MQNQITLLRTEYASLRPDMLQYLADAFSDGGGSPCRVSLESFFSELGQVLGMRDTALEALDTSRSLVHADVAMAIARAIATGGNVAESVMHSLDTNLNG